MIKAAFIQFVPYFGDLNKTIILLDKLIDKSKSADLLVLPELTNSGYNFNSKEQAFQLAESIKNSKFIRFLHDKCRRHDLYIVSGFNEIDDGKLYNSAVLIGPSGFIGKYRKIHLFMNEKNIFSRGNLGFPVFDIGFCKIGILICFDHLFPEAWRILALKGAEVICHPSNLITKFAQKVVPVHALINRFFVITANRIGKEKELEFTGKSIIVNTVGEIIYQAHKDAEEIGIIEIDPEISKDKMITPGNHILNDRIPEEYSELINKI